MKKMKQPTGEKENDKKRSNEKEETTNNDEADELFIEAFNACELVIIKNNK